MKKGPYFKQAELMLRCIPAIADEPIFALKGGTAINMFVRPMPRLSVDLDLTYLPIEDREASIEKIGLGLKRIASGVRKTISGAHVYETAQEGKVIKLVVQKDGATVKIEPNPVIRGTTAPPIEMELVKEAQDLFEMSASIPVVPLADLYGGKICAALDRQHPRDLFDTKLLFDNEGLTDEIRKGFLVYLASHSRPMHELIGPRLKDLEAIYNSEFVGMADPHTPLEDLYVARETLIKEIKRSLTDDEKSFLLSFKSAKPLWGLLGVPGVERLPAVQWKLQNIRQMSEEKRNEQLLLLEKRLG